MSPKRYESAYSNGSGFSRRPMGGKCKLSATPMLAVVVNWLRLQSG